MRALLFETRSGNPIRDLERSEWSYDTGILASDSLSITVPAYSRHSGSLNLLELLARDKHSIALIDESIEGQRRVAAAGPIVTVSPSEDTDGNNTYEVECRGIERLLDWRHVRLYPGWPLLDSSGIPTGVYDQVLTGLSYGTIMKRLIAESEKFLGGDLPIVYEPDRAGTRQASYDAITRTTVLDAIDQLADLENGVEYDFYPVIDDLDHVSYLFLTGTDESKIVSRADNYLWNLGGNNPDIKSYSRDVSATPFITDSIFSGGKSGDSVMLARGQMLNPIDDGLPRAELWDSSHSSVSIQDTLQSWANGALGEISDRISFSVKKEHAYNLRHGDMGQLAVQGHWDLLDDEYDVRVLSVSRSSSDPDWVSLKLV